MGDLGDLLRGKGLAASATPATSEPVAAAQDAAEPDWARQAKVVLRVERKGRGGKTATLVQQVQATPAQLTHTARLLAKALGTQARVEGVDLVVGGDQRDRVAAWLEARGVRRIVR
ncbi:MAG: translation initiation factor [Alphaproteobacteria bacterium]|nr:translation initiation factor [Alphaproteobacteria bacterium]